MSIVCEDAVALCLAIGFTLQINSDFTRSDLAKIPPDRHRRLELERPFSYAAKKHVETGDKSLIWEGHKAGRDIGHCHLEKLHDLGALPPDGFMSSCFPHKIRSASTGLTRAVAIIGE